MTLSRTGKWLGGWPLTVVLVLGWFLVISVPPAAGQGDPGEDGDLSVEMVDGFREAAAGADDLADEVQEALAGIYGEARDELGREQQSRDAAAKFLSLQENLSAELEKIAAEESALAARMGKGELVSRAEEELSPEELQTLLRSEEAALVQAEERLRKVNASLAGASDRPAGIPNEVAAVQEELSLVEDELSGDLSESDPASTVFAESVRARARAAALRARLDELEAERISLPARLELMRAEKELLEKEVSHRTARVAALRGLARAGVEGMARAAEEAAGEARQAGDEELAGELFGAAESLRAASVDLIGVEDRLNEYRERLAEIDQEYSLVKRQVEADEGEGVSAQALMDQQSALPDPRVIERVLRQEKSAWSRVRIEHLEVERELARLEDEETAEGAPTAVLVEALRELERQYARLVLKHSELQLVGQRYLARVAAFDELLSEKLFWVRSSPPISLGTLRGAPAGLQWLAGPARWPELVTGFTSTLHRNSIRLGLLATLAVVLFLLRPRFRKRMESHREHIRRVTTDNYWNTLETLGILFLISFPFSLIMWVLGRQLLYNPDASVWAQGLAEGVMTMAPVLFAFVFVREICRPEGLAEAHLRVRRPTVDALRRLVTAIGWVWIPAGVALTMVFAERSGHHVHTVGRLIFVVAMLWIAFWLGRQLHPTRGAFAEQLARLRDRMVGRLRWIWYGLLVLVPLFLAGLACFGYLVTALTLSSYLGHTVAIIVGSVLLYGLLLRWFRIRERKLALERILEERRARREEAEAAGEEVCPGEEGAPVEEEQLDLAQVGLQTRRLLRAVVVSGAIALLWVVWAGALPVLKSLDGVTLLGSASVADVLVAVVIVVATVIVARNLPGILEIAVLQNLPMDGGSRYAISTLAQYVIVAVGALLTFNMLSFDWSKLGWAVAALSVGLGFGLQEIVANFVCGIILLFERPIRVGDIVTVSNVTGSVTRIRMRATTITDWDRKEFVVPNKEFITGQLLNWTLSNTTNRIVIKVGVAYGSDTDRVRDILLDVLDKHPDIMADPAPIVTFENFGDSSLDFVVRCYLPNMERRILVTHELYSTIHRRFLEEGIEIPFPQRDLHLRSDTTKG